VTEPKQPDDAPLEREVREAARGESARTPALVLGGVGALIAAVVAIVAVVAFLIFWLA
jgi:5,10-methenyltetrahydromethanopterin hydrogenase